MSDNIYTLIGKISKESGALAPEKAGGLNFAFRGVAQVTDHLAPLLQKYGVIVVPEVLDWLNGSREVGTKVITQTEVRVKYTFIAPDGSSLSATTLGLAQDFSDRSAAQAQSVSFRVALLQTFFLPNREVEPEVMGEEVQKVIAAEKATAKTAAAKAAGPARKTVSQLKAEVGKLVAGGRVTGADVDAYGAEVSRDTTGKWKEDGAVLEQVIAKFGAQ